MAFTAIMALGVAALVRNTAIAIGIMVAALFVLPIPLSFAPIPWLQTSGFYLFGNTVSCLTDLPSQVNLATGSLTFVTALWVSALWAIVPLAAGFIALWRRDA
jgi:hypothetical protein